MSNKANLRLALVANKLAEHGTLGRAAAVLINQLDRVLFSCDIGLGSQTDPCCEFCHLGLGRVIHPDAVVGRNCRFFQHVTIGSAWSGCSR